MKNALLRQMMFLLCAAAAAASDSAWVQAFTDADPEGVWANAAAAHDGDLASYAEDHSNRAGDGGWLVMTLAEPTVCDRVRVTADFGYGVNDAVRIEIEVDGSWVAVLDGPIDNALPTDIGFTRSAVTAVRFRYHYTAGGYYFWLYELGLYHPADQVSGPAVATQSPSSISGTTAVLHGRVADDGGAPVQARFVYGVDGGSDTTTAWTGSFGTGGEVSLPLRDLVSGATYHAHLEAQHADLGDSVSSAPITCTTRDVIPGDGTTWVAPTSATAPDGGWTDADAATDDDPSTAARCFHPMNSDQWSPFLVLGNQPQRISQVRVSAGQNAYIDAMQIDVHRDGDWTTVFSGGFADQQPSDYAFVPGVVDATRVRFHTASGSAGLYFLLYDVALRVNETVTAAIPASSYASPVSIAGSSTLGDHVSATANGGNVALQPLSDTTFAFDVTLDPSAPTAIAVQGDSDSASGSTSWAATVLDGTASRAIRTGDSLLFQAAHDGSWRIMTSSGTFRPDEVIAQGDQRVVLFDQPGHFTALAVDATGAQVASIDITVVSVAFPHHVADEVGYERPVGVVITPSDAVVSFTGDPRDLVVTPGAVIADEQTIRVRPIRRGTPRIVAHVGDAAGAIVAVKEVDEFTMDTSALASAVASADTDVATAVLTIRPYVADQWFFFSMFAHTATFRGGATSFSINTSQPESSIGDPGFRVVHDDETNEDIGVFAYDLEVPLGEDKYCFTLHGEQINSPPVQNTSTDSVNGHVCHVKCFESVIFTHDLPEEDEKDSTGREYWRSRQWTLVSQSFCPDGDCPVTYRLTVGSPSLACASVDNPKPALFGGAYPYSDCKACDNTCGPVTPPMDSGTIPGHYHTGVVVCGGGILGSATGGGFWVSKLDADGASTPARNDPFPPFAEMLPKRPGTTALPVIQIDFGGDGGTDTASLYGWTGEPACPPMNTWQFTAMAQDAETGENVPSGYTIKWNLGVDYSVVAEKDGQPVTVQVAYPIGRWFPRLEVWKQVPGSDDMLVGYAEIHSIAVEGQPASNVPLKGPDVSDDLLHGTRFQVSNDDGGLAVDARIGVVPPSPDGPRGRVSLDGYPQNEYWCQAGDLGDLPQVVQVPDCQPQIYYLQGYAKVSQERSDLKLRVEGQALLETCDSCNKLHGSPVVPEWQETDTEHFASFQVELVTRSDSDGEVHRLDDVTTKCLPRPVVQLSIDNTYTDSSGGVQVLLSGSVTDPLADTTGTSIPSVDFYVNGESAGSATPSGTQSGDPVWDPTQQRGTFTKEITIPDAGGTYVITAEAIDQNNEHGRAEVAVATQLQGVDQVMPNLGTINPTPESIGLTLAFDQAPSATVTDLMHVYFGNRMPTASDGTATETGVATLVFAGALNVVGDPSTLPITVTLNGPVVLDENVVDHLSASLQIGASPGWSTTATFTETGPNSLVFVEDGGLIQGGTFGDQNNPHTTTLKTVSVAATITGGQTQPGWIEPYTARIKGPVQAGDLSITVNGTSYSTVSTAFSDGSFQAAGDSGSAKIFVDATNFAVGGGGDKINAEVTPPDGVPAGDETVGEDDGPEDTPPPPPKLPKHTTKEEMLQAFAVLYGDIGQELLADFFLKSSDNAPGNSLVVEHLFFRKYDFVGFSDDFLTIYVSNDIDPITAANALWAALYDALPYMRTKIDADTPNADQLLQDAQAGVAKAAANTTLPLVKAYIAGLTMTNEGANLAMVISDLSQGDLVAAMGIIPFVPAGVIKPIKVISKITGEVLFEASPALRAAIQQINKLDSFAERWNSIRATVDEATARLLVKGGAIFGPRTRSGLRTAMLKLGAPPARLIRAVAHHDLPWKFRNWFAEHGIDCNEVRFGRWVEGVKGAPHGKWSAAFNAEWQAFIDAESEVTPYTAQQIIDQMTAMRSSGRYPSW